MSAVTAAAKPASIHRRRRRRQLAFLLSLTSLFLLTPLWLSLVFSSSCPPLLPSLSPHYSPFPFLDSASPFLPLFDDSPLGLDNVVFDIASSAHLWPVRREYVRLWWRPRDMRGHVWLDRSVPEPSPTLFPALRLSEDSTRFRYTNPTGHPSGLRIARIISESFRLGQGNVRWFVLCDDDTIMSPDNLVDVLSKYDWTEMVYVGTSSESHASNTDFSHNMAFGGGGIAISYPLARMLVEMLDECLERYPMLYGSDDRLHACIAELGVPLSHENGFHQWDIRGDAHGLLAAHPIAPFVSLHHVGAVNPIYPGLNSLESLRLLTKAMLVEQRRFLQHSICYDRKRKFTFSISLGYVVQVFPNIILPWDLERAEKTYMSWDWKKDKFEFDFDTKDAYGLCRRPMLFFLKDAWKDGKLINTSYLRSKDVNELKKTIVCFPQRTLLPNVKEIQVVGQPLSKKWHLVPRRLRCKINETVGDVLVLEVGQ